MAFKLYFMLACFLIIVARGYETKELKDVMCSAEEGTFCRLLTQELDAVGRWNKSNERAAVLNKYLSSFLRRKLIREQQHRQYEDSDFISRLLWNYKIRHVIAIGTNQTGAKEF